MFGVSSSLGVFDSIFDMLKNFGTMFVDSRTSMPTDLFLYISVAVLLIYCIGIFIVSTLSYESRVIRMLTTMNKWFYHNPELNNDNIKEFNTKMKQVPKPIRVRWQTYVLFRDKKPSEYMTFEDCIERPMKYSSFSKSIKNINLLFNIFFSLLVLVILAGIFGRVAEAEAVFGSYLVYFAIVPVIILILKWLFNMVMNLRMNAMVTDIYTDFAIFLRALDKASYSLPEYIDYEMLFTPKEINNSIPILQDYIEERERKAQELLKQAQEAEVEQEKYDFTAVGNNASLLLERALKESTYYLNNKSRLLAKINQKKDELESLQKNYQNNVNEYEKQLQLSRENLQRLKYSLETSTSRVEANRIKKQQDEELKRQEEVEKNINDQAERFNNEADKIKVEIKKFEDELADKKRYIENIIMAEFRTYSTKIYDDINEQNKQKFDEALDDLKEDNEILMEELKEKMLQLKNAGIPTQPSMRYLAKQEKKRAKEEEARKQKEKEDEKRVQEAIEVTEKANASLKDNSVEVTDENGNVVKVSAFTEAKKDAQNDSDKKDSIQYDENGAYYDENGNYVYQDGTYYDTEGNYHDAEGNIILPGQEQNTITYDENGAYYDSNGNYVYQDGSFYDNQGRYHDAEGNIVDQASSYDPYGYNKQEYDENGGYYDAQGYYRYKDGSYYDPLGNYYDSNGNLVSSSDDNNK